MQPIDAIDIAEVKRALEPTCLGAHMFHFASVGSTNALALEAAQNGVRCGAWIADEQTAGRGRGGHTWHSSAGDGLYVSALFSPALPAANLQLSLAAGLASWEAIRAASGLTVDIRWPNDLVTRDTSGSRKLGGILVETAIAPAAAASEARLRYAVIGIGINVGHRAFPAELAGAATSLRLEGWGEPSRQALLIELLRRLDASIAALENAQRQADGNAGLHARFGAASTWVQGKRVRVAEAGGYTGVTAGLDAHGFLQVRDDDGKLRTVVSGGVREA